MLSPLLGPEDTVFDLCSMRLLRSLTLESNVQCFIVFKVTSTDIIQCRKLCTQLKAICITGDLHYMLKNL